MPKKNENKTGDSEDKLATLKAFRRANNLCFTCGEKWTGKGHKCPTQVSIHVLQELLDAIHAESDPDSESNDEDSEVAAGQVVMTVQPMTHPVKKSRILRFKGIIDNQEILILLDSRSSGTFVNTELVDKLKLFAKPCDSMQFLSADGRAMLSDGVIPSLQWNIQGYTFEFDSRILPFKGYDLILGADWLENHSPMWFHWKRNG